MNASLLRGDLLRRYRRLFAIPGFRTSVIAALAGKLQPGMYGLSLLALASSRLDYSTATLVVSGASLGAVTTPLRGRLLDRYAYSAVLWPLSALHSAGVVVFVICVRAGVGAPVLFGLAMGSSMCMPPIGTLTRVMWRQLTTAEIRTTALALDAVLSDVGFMIGPVLAVFLAQAVAPEAALITCALLVLVAVPLVLRASGGERAVPAGTKKHWAGPLRSPGVRWGFVVAFFFLLGVNDLEAVLASYGGRGQVSVVGGVLLGVIAVASMAGGGLLGALPVRFARRLMRPAPALAAIALCVLPLVAALPEHPVLVFLACGPVGFCLGPCFASIYKATGDSAAEGEQAEAQSWVAGAMMAGGALGTAAGGWGVQYTGPAGALALAPTAWLVAAAFGTRLGRIPLQPGSAALQPA
jgi:predicted MFS family arabinose efflux permease